MHFREWLKQMFLMICRQNWCAAECPYYRTRACAGFFDYLRENSCSLAERIVQYFCHDHYTDCARYKVMQRGTPAEQVGQLGP